ncbi:RNA polymerase sigma factor [Paraliomyxa miuraensis]|uniref:RNA polymerase sigma factor n=1 Tax=Paraliomyxa miuraensis TaxID=376150 RepID=UPI002255DD4D|nr:sigma-70 family RNA polymerase sigma factor [Paraliomyxa miuraensis]MCX4246350.1 sigma-70 family RNA polymerase sigma factor [Paraliomyxa miuraensis]
MPSPRPTPRASQGEPQGVPIDARGPTPRSLRRIYDEHHAFVRRNAIRLGIPHGHADDVVQEVFVTLVRRSEALGEFRSMRALLFAIERRVCANYRRKLDRKAVQALPAAALLAVDDDGFDRIEAAHTVARFLRRLDEPRREVFVLAELEGMSAPEIAEALGINVNTVYTRLRAARQRFFRLVSAREEHHGG